MKWSNFRELRLQNQWLSDPKVLRAMVWHFSQENLREFVRKQLSYIAFRPFETLDLKAERFVLDEATNGWVNYFLFFHFEGHPERQMRADTLEEMIEAVKELNRENEWSHHKVVWDRIVKETLAHHRFSLEVYPFPPGFGAPSLPPDKPMTAREREARLAYLDRTPMPPIMPGEILNA